MKFFVVISLAILSVMAAPDVDHYDSKYDDFDIDSVIRNTRLMKGYANCFLGKGNCTPDGHNFKKLLPEALETGCEKCTPKQKKIIRKVIIAFNILYPEEFEEMKKTYDPEGKFSESVKKFLIESD